MNRWAGCLFLLLLAGCSRQVWEYDGRRLKEVTVTDMRDLYGTFRFSVAEREQLRSRLRNPELMDEIEVFSQESSWPEAVNTLEKRLDVRSQMRRYRCYRVAATEAVAIVAVPAERNRHMPPVFRPEGPMYMVVKIRSVIPK
ncbi:MAG TPA: hypothetical protein PKE07_09370 [Lacibacter sp.]|nr:hypothetical protein [Lacibacter sp.]HMO89406.1 hypothetical protein [Lacibacter sp.]